MKQNRQVYSAVKALNIKTQFSSQLVTTDLCGSKMVCVPQGWMVIKGIVAGVFLLSDDRAMETEQSPTAGARQANRTGFA